MGLKGWFNRLKLNIRFTLMMGVIVFVQLTVFFLLVHRFTREQQINSQMNSMKLTMTQRNSAMENAFELCTLTTQSVVNNSGLKDYLIRLYDGEKISTLEMMKFKNEDLIFYEKLVNSNPYLRNIRIYVDNDEMNEIMPFLYKKQRMESFPWGTGYRSGEWEFNYSNSIFYKSVSQEDHLMGLITTMEDSGRGEVAVVEVSMQMDSVFPEAFRCDDNVWSGYMDRDGALYYGSQEECKWSNMTGDILALSSGMKSEPHYVQTKLGGDYVLVGFFPMSGNLGTMVQLVNLQDEMNHLNLVCLLYAFLFLLIFFVVAWIINGMVRRLLRQSAYILETVNQVKEGNLDTRVPVLYEEEEMGQLAGQINEMLQRIQDLYQAKVQAEVLVKNSEIRALQNQINAHFIYNVLESIKMLAEIDEKYIISDAITALGKLLRYSMKWTSKSVTVAEEIEYIRNYIQLVNLRYDYEIYLSLNLPEEIYQQEIPKMSLQPIIENAIVHGIEEVAEDTSIYMKGFIRENFCYIEISDAGRGMTREQVEKLRAKINGAVDVDNVQAGSGNGIGLKNVQDRLQIFYGQECGITIESQEHCYTKIIVKFPRKGRDNQ